MRPPICPYCGFYLYAREKDFVCLNCNYHQERKDKLKVGVPIKRREK